MTSPAPRDLRRDLLAAVMILLGLTMAAWSIGFGGWPFVFVWCALILFGCAGVLGVRERTPARAPDQPAPDDDNALQIVPERGPDTT